MLFAQRRDHVECWQARGQSDVELNALWKILSYTEKHGGCSLAVAFKL